MAVPRKVAEYHEPFNVVTMDLIKSIKRSRNDSNMLIDTTALLQKWAFESVLLFFSVHLNQLGNVCTLV